MIFLKFINFINFIKNLFRRFYYEDNCASRAASLAYTSLLSLVPLAAVSLSIFSFFPSYQHYAVRIQDFIFSNFIPSSGSLIKNYIQTFVGHTTNLSIIGSLFLIITAVLMIFNMEIAFNAIWNVQQHRKRIYGFLLYWIVLLLSPILLSAILIIMPYLHMISSSLPMLASVIIFSFFYIAIPNCHVPFKNGIIAGFIAAGLFELAKKGFALYLFYFPTYNLYYGAVAIVPIFLTWLYIVWLIILFGAEISYALTHAYRRRKDA
ncbi:MAG TPA: YihY family inner membrane protein [Gammaproteobacteria bacterium]|nr:YihY family inner membrane protein [Gammaproteobacteria bacterium]